MTYDQLQLALHAYSHRQDPETVANEANALEFARLAVSRRLRTPEALASFSGSVSTGQLALPADFAQMESVVSGAGDELEFRSMRAYAAEQVKREGPRTYTFGNGVLMAPAALGTVAGTYYATPPAIAGTATNWLSVSYSDIWLAAALAEQWRFTQDYEAAMQADSYWIGLVESAHRFGLDRTQSGGAIRMKGR